MQGRYDDAAHDVGVSAIPRPCTRPAADGADAPSRRPTAASFSFRDVGGCRVLDAAGEIDLATAGAFRTALLAAVEGSDRLVVDVSAVTFIDCAGLSALATVLRHVRAAGGGLRLVGATGIVGRVVALTRLDRVVVVEHTVEDAVASMSRAVAS